MITKSSVFLQKEQQKYQKDIYIFYKTIKNYIFPNFDYSIYISIFCTNCQKKKKNFKYAPPPWKKT